LDVGGRGRQRRAGIDGEGERKGRKGRGRGKRREGGEPSSWRGRLYQRTRAGESNVPLARETMFTSLPYLDAPLSSPSPLRFRYKGCLCIPRLRFHFPSTLHYQHIETPTILPTQLRAPSLPRSDDPSTSPTYHSVPSPRLASYGSSTHRKHPPTRTTEETDEYGPASRAGPSRRFGD
jgi:hypothetical protein